MSETEFVEVACRCVVTPDHGEPVVFQSQEIVRPEHIGVSIRVQQERTIQRMQRQGVIFGSHIGAFTVEAKPFERAAIGGGGE